MYSVELDRVRIGVAALMLRGLRTRRNSTHFFALSARACAASSCGDCSLSALSALVPLALEDDGGDDTVARSTFPGAFTPPDVLVVELPTRALVLLERSRHDAHATAYFHGPRQFAEAHCLRCEYAHDQLGRRLAMSTSRTHACTCSTTRIASGPDKASRRCRDVVQHSNTDRWIERASV